MRSHCWLLLTCLIPLAGCAHTSSSPTVPSAEPLGAAATTLGSALSREGIASAALGLYRLTLDPASLSASLELQATREGVANDDVYLLSIDNFLRDDSLSIVGVTGTSTTIDVTWRLTHPFLAPSDPSGVPNGATNRADLGVAGQVVLLLESPTPANDRYFDETGTGGGVVIAETSLVANADGYIAPAGLLALALTANTFPYHSFVAEDGPVGSRIGRSNGGDPAGNFGTDGWILNDMGPTPPYDGWTGYGVLHQGQSSERTISLDRAALAVYGPLTFDVAVLAKYNDPRQGTSSVEKRAHRLPTASGDASIFGYRMPHGALDCERIAFVSESGGFLPNVLSASTLNFHLIDWDTRAIETSAAELSEDPDVTTVAVGESGAPDFAVCLPGVLGDATAIQLWDSGTDLIDDDSAVGGDVAQDSGYPGDALFYSRTVTKAAGAGQLGGEYTGMIRATDPEAALAPPLAIALDGTTLAPLTANLPLPITYQAFAVQMGSPNVPPTATVALTSSDPLLSGTSAAVSLTGIADAESDLVDVLVDWGDGLGFQSIITGMSSPYPNQTPSSPPMKNLDLVADTINLTVRLADASGQTDYPLSYQLGPNRPPQVSGLPALSPSAVPSPANFTVAIGTASALDPEGDTVSFSATNDRNANAPTSAAFPFGLNTSAITNPPNATATFTVRANDPLHAGTNGTAWPTLIGAITIPGGGGWAKRFGGTSPDVANAVAVDTAGNCYVVGSFYLTVDFGGGARTSGGSQDIFIVKLDSGGNYVWDKTFSGTHTDEAMAATCDSAGNLYVGGYHYSVLDFGGGPFSPVNFPSSSGDMWMAKYNPAGTHLLSKALGTAGLERLNDIAVDGSGNVILGGTINGTMNFGGGVRSTSSYDAFAAKYDGTTGAWLWDRESNGPNVDYGNGVAADNAGNVFLAGQCYLGTDWGGGFVATNGSSDACVVKYNTSGTWQWQRMFGGTSPDLANDVAVNSASGNSIVMGYYYISADFGTGPIPTAGGSDGFAVMLNPAGTHVWNRTFGSTNSDTVTGAVIDTTGSAILTGNYGSSINFGGGSRASTGGLDCFAAKYGPTGTYVWDALWGNPVSSDLSTKVGVDGSGDVRAVGSFYNTADFDPSAAVFNLTTNGSTDAYVVKVLSATGRW